jgi:hypothetical protein
MRDPHVILFYSLQRNSTIGRPPLGKTLLGKPSPAGSRACWQITAAGEAAAASKSWSPGKSRPLGKSLPPPRKALLPVARWLGKAAALGQFTAPEELTASGQGASSGRGTRRQRPRSSRPGDVPGTPAVVGMEAGSHRVWARTGEHGVENRRTEI